MHCFLCLDNKTDNKVFFVFYHVGNFIKFKYIKMINCDICAVVFAAKHTFWIA